MVGSVCCTCRLSNLPSLTFHCHVTVLLQHFLVLSHPGQHPRSVTISQKSWAPQQRPVSQQNFCSLGEVLRATTYDSNEHNCVRAAFILDFLPNFPFQIHGPIVFMNNNSQRFSIQTPPSGNLEVIQKSLYLACLDFELFPGPRDTEVNETGPLPSKFSLLMGRRSV